MYSYMFSPQQDTTTISEFILHRVMLCYILNITKIKRCQFFVSAHHRPISKRTTNKRKVDHT